MNSFESLGSTSPAQLQYEIVARKHLKGSGHLLNLVITLGVKPARIDLSYRYLITILQISCLWHARNSQWQRRCSDVFCEHLSKAF